MLSGSGPGASGSGLGGHGESAFGAGAESLITSSADDVDDIDWQYFDERAYIDAKIVKEGEDAYARNKFNQAASDKLASNRLIPDTRSAQCKARDWSGHLPETSVIITFHNEARSTLLRTIVR